MRKKPKKNSMKDGIGSNAAPGGRENGFLKGSVILAAGNFFAKAIGAFYRVPLTNLLGSQGIGIYQMVFPIYCILLTFSSSGVPSAIAKLVASGENEKGVLGKSLAVFGTIGAVGSLAMLLLARPLALLQGDERAALAYRTLSPSVFLVSFISCFRGYFQGKNNMFPTALSQTIEQAVKLTAGLSLCFFFRGDPALSGALACLAVTVSEGAACAYLLVRHRKNYKEKVSLYADYPVKKLLFTVLPIAAAAILVPLSRMADSFAAINILKRNFPDATSLYGIYTGGVESIAGVPVAVCYGAAAASVPTVAGLLKEGKREKAKKKATYALLFTCAVSLACAAALYFGARLIVGLLYAALPGGEKILMTKLLKAASATVVLLAVMQTANSLLVANGRLFAPPVFLLIGVIVKIPLEIVLLFRKKIGIFAIPISDIACYLIAVFCDLVYIRYINKSSPRSAQT